MYHYVRDLPNTRFPRIHGMLLDRFYRQVRELRATHEMATLEIALDYLQGRYVPPRDLCLLTFDDGLKEHYRDVTPILHELRIQGLFFLITSCPEERRVAPVHMNHFLMASLGVDEYSRVFRQALDNRGCHQNDEAIDWALATRTYPWDMREVAHLKYLFNFVLDAELRDSVVTGLFEDKIGKEPSFSEELYVGWDEARAMQRAGMAIGGHTHRHRPLATLSEAELAKDVRMCRCLLHDKLDAQNLWPFCYPYGKTNSFDERSINALRDAGFVCSFTTETGLAATGMDLFSIRRFDCNRIELPARAA